MKNIWLQYFAFALVFISTQSFLNYTFFSFNKKIAKHALEKYIAKHNYKATIKETDSTIELSVRDPSIKPYDEILYFRNNKNCYKQTEIYDCDSCLKKEVTHFFENKRLNWVKISNEKYVANKKFILEITSKGTNFSYTLKKEKLSNSDYETLLRHQ